MALTLPEGHEFSRKQSLRASFFAHFWTDQDEIWWLSNFCKQGKQLLFYLLHWKTLTLHAFWQLWPVWLKLGMLIDATKHDPDTNLSDRDLFSGS